MVTSGDLRVVLPFTVTVALDSTKVSLFPSITTLLLARRWTFKFPFLSNLNQSVTSGLYPPHTLPRSSVLLFSEKSFHSSLDGSNIPT